MATYDIAPIDFTVDGARIGVVAARFNHTVVDALLEGALGALREHGIHSDAITVVRVPGAVEIPLTAQRLAHRSDVEAVIALGAVVRGETAHGDYVAGECARGITRVSLDQQLPVIFGVLTTDNMAQALARAGGDHGNKGREAALAALEMITLLRRIEDAF